MADRFVDSVRATAGPARFPDGKRFAFSVFDDTDNSTVANVEPVYRLLHDLGMRTTKSVWPLANASSGQFLTSSTLQDSAYRQFVVDLQRSGFEIAYHGARNDSSPRPLIENALDIFASVVGSDPESFANHSANREGIYWGSARFGHALPRLGYRLGAVLNKREAERFEGHVIDSPYFWGDLCQQRVKFVRNFTFDEINLDRVNPTMPYHDPAKPYVQYWFSAVEAGNAERFCESLTEDNQDRLEAEGGLCIVATHFAKGFCPGGVVHPQFERLMRRLAGKGTGWFVPVAELLNRCLTRASTSTISPAELGAMERRFVVDKLRKRLGTGGTGAGRAGMAGADRRGTTR